LSTNEHVVRKSFDEFWSAGRLELAQELLAPDHVHHIADQDVHGPDAVKEMARSLREAFPDLRFLLEDLLMDADKVAVRWTALGRHAGPLGDLQATGRRARWTGIDLVRLRDGQIVELWASADAMGLYEQLTATDPSP
jgi:predicted ester cyclase